MMYKELFDKSCMFYKLANENFINEELKDFFKYEISVPNIISKFELVKFYSKNIDESFVSLNYLKIDNQANDEATNNETIQLIINDIIRYFDDAQDNFIGLIDELRIVDELSMPKFNIKLNRLIKNYKNFDYIQDIFYEIYQISNNTNNELKEFELGSQDSFIDFENIINGVNCVIDLFIKFCKIMKLITNYNEWKHIKQNLEMWWQDIQNRFKDFTNDPMNDENISSDVSEYLNQQGEYEIDSETGETLEPKVLTEYGKEFLKNPNLNDVYEGKFGQ